MRGSWSSEFMMQHRRFGPAILPCVTDGPDPGYERFDDPVDGTRWFIDTAFTDSSWACLWGRGCEGILDRPAAHLNQGCCSVGAQMLDTEEARRIGGLGASLDPERFQYHEAAAEHGVFADETRAATRIVDDACIFFNRPGFAGGEGCALHLAALDDGENPLEYKPAICWQAPLKVDHHDDGSKTLRPWRRDDWGGPQESMAWCCTDRDHNDPALPSAYVGDQPVAVTLHAELRGLVGPEIAVELRNRLR